MGYKDFVQQPVLVIPPDKMDVALGTLKVEEDAKVLQEVQITAEKSFMQLNAEKKIFNMEKNTISAGGTAIDALKQVPMVEADQDGNLSMRGSGNLRGVHQRKAIRYHHQQHQSHSGRDSGIPD